MESKHTPGPWELDGIAIAGSDHRMGDVCLMGDPARYAGDVPSMCDNWEANARLIAAAPELLPFVELIASIPIEPVVDDVPVFGLNGVYITHGTIRLARAAIAKATGK